MLITIALIAGAARLAHAATQGAGQNGFEVVDSSQQTERMPAAPLLIGAYAFVWVALAGYVLSVWRRVNRVEAEMRDLRARLTDRSAPASRR